MQTRLWSLFLKLGNEYSYPSPIQFPGLTILWGPCGFWMSVPPHPPTPPPAKTSLILTQALSQSLILLSAQGWAASS